MVRINVFSAHCLLFLMFLAGVGEAKSADLMPTAIQTAPATQPKPLARRSPSRPKRRVRKLIRKTAKPASLTPDVAQRIEAALRAQYNVPRTINISLSELKPSEQPGYDQFTVTFTGKTTSTHEFLISTDRKTLAHLEKIDLAKVDLPADLMAKIDVSGRPVRGNQAAKVTIVNYDDFQCPFCSRMHATLFPALLKQYGDQVRFIYKDYPLVEIHPWAMHAAIDANCLAEQNNDAYWEFADYIHNNQRAVAGKNPEEAFANLDKAAQEEAGKHKLDEPRLNACLKKQDEGAVRTSMAQGDKIGVDSTPTLFINGERVSGYVPEQDMRVMIDRALADAGKASAEKSAKK